MVGCCAEPNFITGGGFTEAVAVLDDMVSKNVIYASEADELSAPDGITSARMVSGKVV